MRVAYSIKVIINYSKIKIINSFTHRAIAYFSLEITFRSLV